MNRTTRILLTTAMVAAFALPSSAWAQRRGSGSNSHRGQATERTQSSAASQRKPTEARRNAVESRANRKQEQVRPATQTRTSTARPSTQTTRTATQARPNTSTTRPATQVRPNSQVTRPNTSTTRPATQVRPNSQVTRPATVRPENQSRPSTRPSATQTRPGSNGHHGNSGNVRPGHDNRPGGNGHHGNSGNVRPGHDNRPGGNGHHGNSGYRPGRPHHGGNSAHRPGSYRPGPRPHYNYTHHNYRPPRPGGGYWGAPPVNIYRPVYYLPPRPPRPVYVSYRVPSIGTILGLTFGSFIDAGINTLFNTGYNVLGYANNVIYLGSVPQLGFVWPEATVYYTDGLMSNTQFQYWSQAPDIARFNNVYAQLSATYGAPVSSNTYNGVTTVSWWGGNNTGYITLQYGPGNSASGMANYYTTLTYSDDY